jgi:hypothetical protein
VEVFDHGDADVGVEGVGGDTAVVEYEVRRDGSGGDADEGTGGAGEVEGGGGVAEGDGGEGGGVGVEEVGAAKVEGCAGEGGAGVQGGEVGSVGAGWVEERHLDLGYAERQEVGSRK